MVHKRHYTRSGLALVIACMTLMPLSAQSQKAEEGKEKRIAPLAILNFEERSNAVEGYGNKVRDLLFAQLVGNPNLYLVDRSEMDKLLKEAELNLSGMVSSDKATEVGKLTGAKLLLTGSVFEVQDKLYVVAKVIGTETSRVLGASVKGLKKNGLNGLVPELAKKIAGIVKDKKDTLLPKPQKPENVIAKLKEQLGEQPRPVLAVQVQEEHIGQDTLDPAVQTELIKIARKVGFKVVNGDGGTLSDAEVILKGEGFSEFATQRNDLVSVKARLELKAVNREEQRVLTADSQTAVVVDLSEQIAGKKALRETATKLAQRILPAIVKQTSEDGE